jgi:tRNA threonylcarbamoyl adenosine modification protein (Sua5/YciO/YrdC/YwlC family)
MLIEILEDNIDQRLINQVVDALKAGELVIYPTDSVYAMGCDLMSKSALEKLARLKNLKLEKSKFSIICQDISQVSEYVKQLDRSTYKMLNKSLPGPFTFILEANGEIPKFFNNKRKEIGIKIPDNKIVLEIVKKLGNPLVTTSLIDDEDELLEYFIDPYEIYQRFDEKVHTIIDGGAGKLEASTIVKCTEGEIEILRQGVGELQS